MPVRKAAVLGSPIAHSLSPVLHRAAYDALGLDWQYSAIECAIDDLRTVLDDRPDWAGFSCTMPLKHAALAMADEATDRARETGAANTLLPCPGGGWRADNTDVAGLLAAFAERGVAPRAMTVLGAGGTAQAAVCAAAATGIARVTVLVRDPSRTDALRATAQRAGVVLDIGPLVDETPDPGLVVSTLPPHAADPFADRHWTPAHTVFDVVYDPWPSALAAAAAAGGATVLSGALLLLHQAAEQVTLMTGLTVPVEPMRAALLAASPGCGA